MRFLIDPFEIEKPDGTVYSFLDSRTDEHLDVSARDHWRVEGDEAALKWRSQKRDICEPNGYDDSVAFDVQRNGEPFGTFGIYAIRPIDQDLFVVSAMCAPILPGLLDSSENGRDDFWRRVFYVMEWILDNPLSTDDPQGRLFDVDEWRLPDRDQPGNCEQHEWIGLDTYTDRYVTKQLDRHLVRRIPIRMRKLPRPRP